MPEPQIIDCPTCKTKLKVRVPDPASTEPQAEKPPASAFDTSALIDRLAKIEKKTEALPEDFCTKFPELCSNMGTIKETVSEIRAHQAQRDEEDAHAHFAPSEELFAHWDGCPECKGKADELAKRLADRARKPAEEKPAEKPPEDKKEESPPPAKEEKPAEEEYIPPWKR